MVFDSPGFRNLTPRLQRAKNAAAMIAKADYDKREAIEIFRSCAPPGDYEEAARHLFAALQEAAREAGMVIGETKRPTLGLVVVGPRNRRVFAECAAGNIYVGIAGGAHQRADLILVGGVLSTRKDETFLQPGPGEPRRFRSAVALVAEMMAQAMTAKD
jgi:hypothetical protein